MISVKTDTTTSSVTTFAAVDVLSLETHTTSVALIPDAELEQISGGFSAANAELGVGCGLISGALTGIVFGTMKGMFHFCRDIYNSSGDGHEDKITTWEVAKSALGDVAKTVCIAAPCVSATAGVMFGFAPDKALTQLFTSFKLY